MRALVTGAGGFVGTYLVRRLRDGGADVFAAAGPRETGDGLVPIDLADMESIRAAFDLGQPEVVFHLAAQTFVPRSIAAPSETYATNVIGTANVLEALRDAQTRANRKIRLIFVSSAEVYGSQPPEAMPLSESAQPRPVNPYAASKLAAEAIVLGETRTFAVDAVVTRAFNHIGPGQDPRFVVPSFASQLAAIAAGSDPVLHVGNLEAKRDFLDVRDVVDAYVALAERGHTGEVYNVCSGSAVAIREMLARLIRIAHVPVEVRESPDRMRPVDVPLTCGDNRKLREATGWGPRITLQRSLQDVYAAAQMSRS